MTPESGNTLLMLLSLLVFTILVSGVCVFFAHNVIPSFKKGTAKGIAFSCIIEAALVALAMFILGSSNDTLSEAFTWLASLNYMWCFAIAVAAVIFNILLARLWGSRRNSWSKET